MNEVEEEEEEEERGEKQKRRSNTTGGEAAGFIQLKRTTTNDDQQDQNETKEGVGVTSSSPQDDPLEVVPVTQPSLSQEVALTRGEETKGEENKGEEEHKETKGEEKDNSAAERERAMIDLQSALADHVRAKYETSALSDDATKPAQKARVIVAMVKSKISMFDTFSESPLLVRQVADFRSLLEASVGKDVWNDGSLFRLEDNLIARAGLLIDLGLVDKRLVEVQCEAKELEGEDKLRREAEGKVLQEKAKSKLKEVNEKLLHACEKGELAEVCAALEVDGVDVNYRGDGGRTPLYWASAKGHVDIVRHLLSAKGIQVNQARDDGITALFMSSQNGHVDIVRLLLGAEGVEVNQADNDGVTALMMASGNGHVDVVRLLLRAEGVEVNQATNDGHTALSAASAEGFAEDGGDDDESKLMISCMLYSAGAKN